MDPVGDTEGNAKKIVFSRFDGPQEKRRPR